MHSVHAQSWRLSQLREKRRTDDPEASKHLSRCSPLKL